MRPPHKLDAGKRRLSKLVVAANEAKPRLPLVHNTDSYIFSDIVDSEKLKPSPCKVFTPENLIYLFYGRPSFRPNVEIEPLNLNHYFPVCLIFDPTLSVQIRRLFPFDSGAFMLDLYKSYLHNKMSIGDFEIKPDPSSPGKIVTTFFSDPESYLKGKSSNGVDVDPTEFEAHTLSALYSAQHSNAMDSRNSSIEIQTEDEIDLNEHLIAAIIPEPFEQSALGKSLRKMDVNIIPYHLVGRCSPNEYMGAIHQSLISYYNHAKILGSK